MNEIFANGTAYPGHFGWNGKRGIPSKAFLLFRKIFTGLNRSIWHFIPKKPNGFSVRNGKRPKFQRESKAKEDYKAEKNYRGLTRPILTASAVCVRLYNISKMHAFRAKKPFTLASRISANLELCSCSCWTPPTCLAQHRRTTTHLRDQMEEYQS